MLNLPKILIIVLLVISACGLLMACGPVQNGNSIRGKNNPMKLKQRLPDTEETSMSASGSYSGRVRRGSEAYEALERNFNPEIVFKDDESNADDRRMTKNCQRKLNILAAAVKSKWGANVKLRVITAYDIDDAKKRHGPHSLHHEGRAVDITTSDRDKAKYPFLGRMAYDAGFDWVYYATKGYIHASVKTDKVAEQETLGCFPETALVRLEGGRTKTMKNLRIGDKVAGMDSTGRIVYSKVVTFLDIKRSRPTAFISIGTKNPAAEVAITESHLIYQLNKHSLRETALFARDLKVGDFVYVGNNGSTFEKFTAGRVVDIKRSQSNGAYAPLTETGNIVVDNILCSCYAVISDPHLAHWSFAPLRFVEWLFPGAAAHEQTGMHWYAKLLYNFYTSWNYIHENFLDNS